MKPYNNRKIINKRRWRKALIVILAIGLLVAGVSLLVVRRVYTNNLQAVSPGSTKQIVIAIPSGSSLNDISNNLMEKGLHINMVEEM